MVSNRAKHQTQLNKQSSNIALNIVLKRHLESSNKKNTRDYSKRKCNKGQNWVEQWIFISQAIDRFYVSMRYSKYKKSFLAKFSYFILYFNTDDIKVVETKSITVSLVLKQCKKFEKSSLITIQNWISRNPG